LLRFAWFRSQAVEWFEMPTGRTESRVSASDRWQPSDDRMALRAAGVSRLIVVIPALNEEKTIERVVRAIPRSISGVGEIDILVVDDGSTDRTAELARGAGAEVVHHPTPRGVGAAFQTALAEAIDHGADLIVNIDADGQFDPADIVKLVAPIIAGDADFVTASRFIDPKLLPDMPLVKRWGNRMMSRLISSLVGQRFFDVSCGMRCYSRRAALSLNLLGRFTYTQEVFLNLAFKHFRIAEVPIRVRGDREFGKSRVAGNLFRYATRTTRIIFRCYRDYYPMRFFGFFGVVLMAASAGFGGFLIWHYLSTGSLFPHKWAGFVAAALSFLSVAMFFAGMIGDMLNRHRIYLEELLYRQRLASKSDVAERLTPVSTARD
jgi:glycosyltransferase involved in cell wall biosynthesis